jgi:hypothetical protein
MQHGKFAMKKLSKAEQERVWERLKASQQGLIRAKSKLITEARAAEKKLREDLRPDGSMDAWFHRKSNNSDFVEKRGGFSRGAAPVRRGKALSRIEISEIAIELLECVAGPKLTCLFQELLDVDRHRKSLSEVFSQLDIAAEVEAQTQLQGKPLGVREFAKQLLVSPSTVTRWKRSGFFWERVKLIKSTWGSVLRAEYFENIKAMNPDASEEECFRRAFQMYIESLPERRARYRRKSTTERIRR